MDPILDRCSIRHFKDRKLTEEEIQALLRAGFSAPSARNLQPWVFVVIEDPIKIQNLRSFSPYAGPLESAPLAILVCADQRVNPSLDYCQQDCAAATENILIQAKAMGLGSCWLGGYPNPERIDKIREWIDLPECLMPLWVIAIGQPDEKETIKNKWNDQKIIRL